MEYTPSQQPVLDLSQHKHFMNMLMDTWEMGGQGTQSHMGEPAAGATGGEFPPLKEDDAIFRVQCFPLL